jgi:hypothetical protein
MGGCGLDLSGSGQARWMALGKHGKEASVSRKFSEVSGLARKLLVFQEGICFADSD